MEDFIPEAGVVAGVTVGAGAEVVGPVGKKSTIMTKWSYKASVRRADNKFCKVYFRQWKKWPWVSQPLI